MKHCDLKTKTQFLLVNKELHREAKRYLIPMVTLTDNERIETLGGKGDVRIVIFYKNVKRMNAINGKDRIEYYNENNKLYRKNAPSLIQYYENGNKKCEFWCNKNGHWDRADGPAQIGWYKDGRIQFELWFKNGSLHRKQSGEGAGPAKIYWCENGNKSSEYWYINGKPRRKYNCRKNTLPYYTSWNNNGEIKDVRI